MMRQPKFSHSLILDLLDNFSLQLLTRGNHNSFILDLFHNSFLQVLSQIRSHLRCGTFGCHLGDIVFHL